MAGQLTGNRRRASAGVLGPVRAVGDVDRVMAARWTFSIQPGWVSLCLSQRIPRNGAGAGALPPQAASAASAPAISIARAASSILTS